MSNTEFIEYWDFQSEGGNVPPNPKLLVRKVGDVLNGLDLGVVDYQSLDGSEAPILSDRLMQRVQSVYPLSIRSILVSEEVGWILGLDLGRTVDDFFTAEYNSLRKLVQKNYGMGATLLIPVNSGLIPVSNDLGHSTARSLWEADRMRSRIEL